MTCFEMTLDRDELADKLGGGLPKGSIVLIEGEYGTGKSAVIQRIVYGLLSHKTSVTYVSTELTTRSFIEQMQSLDYPVEEAILDMNLLFIPVIPTLGHKSYNVDPLQAMLRAPALYESQVVVFDCFSTLLKTALKMHEKKPKKVEEEMDQVIHMLKVMAQNGKSFVLTIDPNDVPAQYTSYFKGVADGLISLELSVVGGSVSRMMLVRRYERADKGVSDMIHFRIEPKTGLLVEIKSVS